jgi:uncharacterized protein YndB with AHSA1/START domain
VKYADGPSTEVEVVMDAPVERVWALVTDINLPARFSSEFQGARWLDAGPALGARFVGRNQHPAAGTWETTCVVTECTPHRTFEWSVGDPDFPSARWRFDLEPHAGGGTRLRQSMQMGPGPSGLTPAIEAMPDKEERIVARRLEEHRANMGATLAGIKELAESEP